MQTLPEFFSQRYSPNADQAGALEALQGFLHSDSRCFLLKGYAGTGKTFLTKGLTQYIQHMGLSPVLLAPTGRAARILSEKTGLPASTIHKGIYNLAKLDEIEINKNGNVSYKFCYEVQTIEPDIRRVYIIDEASMISNTHTEDDFFVFGSGRLLNDLMSLIAPNNLARYNKIIFVGDQAQLPPVTDRASGALSANYLLTHFQIRVQEYELTEVIRQQNESGIVQIATQVRTMMSNPKRNSFQLNNIRKVRREDSDIGEVTREEVVDLFLEEVAEKGLESTVMINYSNKDSLDYNLQIKNKLHGGTQLVPGDILMVNQNNYNYTPELYNGMLVKVIEVTPQPEIRTLKSYDQQGQDCMVSHKFRRVVIELEDQGKAHQQPCLILENFLYSPDRSLDYKENIALYIDFKIRHPNLKVKTPEFKEALRSDLYFNALRVKFGYSITCHKAQGGEWETALVNLSVGQSVLSDFFLRWTYTAITRARSRLYLFNIPSTSPFSKLNYKPMKLTETATISSATDSAIMLELTPEIKQQLVSLGLITAGSLLLEKYVEILARIQGKGIQVTNRAAHQYQEIYTFEREGVHAVISMFYNGKGQFTRIQPHAGSVGDPALITEMISLLEQPFAYKLREAQAKSVTSTIIEDKIHVSPDEVDLLPHFFKEDTRYLLSLYAELNTLLADYQIKIQDVQHNSYQERYFFIRNNEKACINFTYDGVGRFTFATPHLRECNSNALLADLEACFDILKSTQGHA